MIGLNNTEIDELKKHFEDVLVTMNFPDRFKGGALKADCSEGKHKRVCCNIKPTGTPGDLRRNCVNWSKCTGDCFKYNI